MAKVDLKNPHQVRSQVREHYNRFAESAKPNAACCGPETENERQVDTTRLLYGRPEVEALPEEVKALSAGCGDPVTLASLEPGQVVLDLGSGGGIDCFFAAQKVGPEGSVIGVDMTPSMLEKARRNLEKVGLANVEFRLGEIEHLPVPDASVDVVISNCVINLSPDKGQVFREAFRVLKPGGRFAVSDIIRDGPLPPALQGDSQAWCECVSGALEVEAYAQGLRDAGFVEIAIERTEFDDEAKADLLAASGIEASTGAGCCEPKAVALVDGQPVEIDPAGMNLPYSARIKAQKPGA